ncbi:inner membrane protein YqaA [Escherichia coli]|uniref:Inner membrane protein YqaA n=1 Tax=Escherichia coli TaxID=562 RepID=A0A376D5K0_ECOLX|nr:inner membrane protein YqaA [Escherichia coli]
MSEALSLFSLFASSFLSATLLPGNSEVVLVAMLLSGISHPWVLVLTATMGNSLGGLTNVILGRFFPLRKTSRWQEKATGWLIRYGAVTAIIKLDARGWRFTVSVSGMDAHLVGTGNLFFVPW